ncbi:MAG: shikimate kinase [Chitinophagales bacterium]|nr:shikimate kinase [Chitinophagales bacterium]
MLYFLIGFMGSGKSYMGRNLSKELEISCIDMDEQIELQEGISIKEIFEVKGENYFRNLEREFLLSLNNDENKIISTGGGAPCFFDNMEIMNQKGLTIYLNRSKETVLRQLFKSTHKRPLLKNKTEEEISQYYDFKLAEREPFYSRAKIHAGDMTYIEVAQMIRSGWL